MSRTSSLVADAVRWCAFFVMLFGTAIVIWPLYVLSNIRQLLASGPYFPAVTGLILLDQLIKVWASVWLREQTAPLVLIPGVLDFRYAENIGAAFSILEGHLFVFVLMALLTVGIITVYVALADEDERLVRAALALILAGAVGNLIDRCARRFVVDYIHVFWGSWDRWPIFNLADILINVGVGIIFLDFAADLLRESREGNKEGSQEARKG